MAVLPAADEPIWYHLALYAGVWTSFFWLMTMAAIAFLPTGLDGIDDLGLAHVVVVENLVLTALFGLTETVCQLKMSHGS